jgi:hypothetical protein
MPIADGRQPCAVVKGGGNIISNDRPRRPACHVERQVFARCVDPHNGLPRDRSVQESKWVPPLVNKVPLCSVKMQACFRCRFLLELQRAC